MNLKDLIAKMDAIEEGVEIKADECGAMPMPGAVMSIGPQAHQGQQDNVSMTINVNGQGEGGLRSIMNILRDIEAGEASMDSDDAGQEEPIMGTEEVQNIQGADSPLTVSPDEEMEEVIHDDGEKWHNSAHGGHNHHTHGLDAVTFSGDDMNGKGKISPVSRAPGTNSLREPSQFDETLVAKLQAHYDSIKEDAGGPINPNAKCNICHTPYAKHFRFDPPGDPTGKRTSTLIRGMCGAVPQNFPDLYSMSESDKKTMSRAAKGNEKYGKDGMKALAKAGREGKDLDKVRDKYDKYDESAKWRDPKYKDKFYTQDPVADDEDDYYNDSNYYEKSRPENDPGKKHRIGGVRSEFHGWDDEGDPLSHRHNITKNSDDPDLWGYGTISSKGPRKGLPTRSVVTSLKDKIKQHQGKHPEPNLPEQMNESVELNDMLTLNKRLNG